MNGKHENFQGPKVTCGLMLLTQLCFAPVAKFGEHFPGSLHQILDPLVLIYRNNPRLEKQNMWLPSCTRRSSFNNVKICIPYEYCILNIESVWIGKILDTTMRYTSVTNVRQTCKASVFYFFVQIMMPSESPRLANNVKDFLHELLTSKLEDARKTLNVAKSLLSDLFRWDLVTNLHKYPSKHNYHNKLNSFYACKLIYVFGISSCINE